ncbi:MAG: cytochrome C oxidase subunit IV family protein [Bacteroides sp.]|nr:MAG: cytochrome C oxidase subunit IV family protein [Bacteroides sp.]
MNYKKIFNIFILLTFFTLIEFYISFFLINSTLVKNIIYIFLTFLKSYYIVFYFMHVNSEKLYYKLLFILPIILLLFLTTIIFIEYYEVL